MGWQVVWPVLTLVIGYFADLGKMSVSGRVERRRRAAEDERATLLAFQDALFELVPVAQDSCIERRDSEGELSIEAHRALYQAHLRAEALRVRVGDESLRGLADGWVSEVYAFGASDPVDGDFGRLIVQLAALNERIGMLIRRLAP